MILAIDTSSLNTSVALFDGDKLVGFSDHFEETHQQSKIIFSLIESFLSSHNVSKKQIDAIAVGVGPGSYTGLRVGMSIAKIWAFSRSIPLYSFSSKAVLERSPERLSLQRLLKTDLQRVDSVEGLKPIYENDHFSKGKSEI